MSSIKQLYVIRDPNIKVVGCLYIEQIVYNNSRYFVPKFKPVSKLISDSYIRYPVYNPYLKHYVWLNYDSLISYLEQNSQLQELYKTRLSANKIRDQEYNLYKFQDQNQNIISLPVHYSKVLFYPYQSVDMRRSGDTRFVSKEDLQMWISNRDQVKQIIGYSFKECPTSLLSEIDIFKMKRSSHDTNYRYLYQLDERSLKTLPTVSKLTEKFCQTDVNKFFIPNLDEPQQLNIVEIEGVLVLNEDKFIDKLSKTVGYIDKGRIMYQLNSLFKSYQKFQMNDIDSYLEEDTKRLYGLTKSELNTALSEYKTTLSRLKEKSVNVKSETDCTELMNSVYKQLAQSTTLAVPPDFESSKEVCYFKSLNLELLVTELEKYSSSYETCDKIPFKLDYVYDHATKDCPTTSNFQLNFELMPEWVNSFNMLQKDNSDKNKQEIMYNRQLVLGDLYSVTEKLQNCSHMLLSDPWYQLIGGVQNLSWSFSVNKMILACLVKKNIKFPVRIEMQSDKVQMYRPYDVNEMKDSLFLGTLLFKVKGERTNLTNRYYELFVYYHLKKQKVLMYNIRGNEVVPGTVNDHVRVFYIELNVLKYYSEDVDPNIQLYYYQKQGSSTYYVSKMSPSEIDNKDLHQVFLTKDPVTKEFYFLEKLDFQKGGTNTWPNTKTVDLSTTNSYKFATEYSSKKYDFSEDYPKELLNTYVNSLTDLTTRLGDSFYVYDAVLRPLFIQSDALKKVDVNIDIVGIRQYTTDWSNISKKIAKLIKEHKLQSILSYPFESTVSLLWFDVLTRFSLINKESNILVVSKNGFGLDTILYYQKFVNYSFKNKNIFTCLYYYDPKLDGGFTRDLLKRNKIDYHNFTDPLNMNTVNYINKKIKKKIDFAFIDLNTVIPELKFVRTNYAFQTILPSITVAVQNLAIKGNILLYIPDISNIQVFNFYVYLRQFFEEGFVYENSFVYWQSHFNNIVLKGYKGGVNIDQLEKIIIKMFECDPTGGLNYNSDSLYCYLNKILDINSQSVYREYCKLMKDVWQQKLDHLGNIHYLSQHPSLISQQLNLATLYNISHIKRLGLKTVEWLDDVGFNKHFYHTSVRNIHSNIVPYNRQFQKGCEEVNIDTHKQIEYRDKDHIHNISKMSENVFQYIEKTDYRMWKNVELFFNNKQKTLQKFLKDECDVNINGRYVSRAWIKMYELLHQTKYFDNLNKDTVKALHVCEAPGSFIASTTHYVKHHTNIKQYDYVAQSWKHGDIFDEFGFIKQNFNRWDFADGTGDIMNYSNLEHYYNKYKGVDSVVGDCGTSWDPTKTTVKDLGVYQMLYAMLIPREGGNFIIKSVAVNYNLQFLSLLYLASCKCEKLFIFRSSRNVWSPEIYIVGVNKKKLSELETTNLFKIAKALEEDTVIYPTPTIGAEFSLEYEYHTQTVTGMFSDIKKFFVYLARNPEEFKKEQENLESFVHRKNIVWLQENMNFIKHVKEKYTQFVNKLKN